MSKTYEAKIIYFQMQYAQRGTCTEVVLSIPTRRQSTNEEVRVEFQYPTKNLFAVLWKVRRDAKAYGRKLQKEPGEHDLAASNFTRGLLMT